MIKIQILEDGISNEIFEIYPYYWGECTCGMEIQNKPCLDSCELMRHNFYYKPLNFWIDWYKYPFRDSYMSHNLNEEEVLKIFKECKSFIERNGNCDKS